VVTINRLSQGLTPGRCPSFFCAVLVLFGSSVSVNRGPNTRPPNLRIAASNLLLGSEMQARSCCWLAEEAGVLRPLDPLDFSRFLCLQNVLALYPVIICRLCFSLLLCSLVLIVSQFLHFWLSCLFEK
jgi:hypothetical protein